MLGAFLLSILHLVLIAFNYFIALPVICSILIFITLVASLALNMYSLPSCKNSGEYFSISLSKAISFSSPSISVSIPKAITLSYFVLNLLGKTSVSPTTLKDTFS